MQLYDGEESTVTGRLSMADPTALLMGPGREQSFFLRSFGEIPVSQPGCMTQPQSGTPKHQPCMAGASRRGLTLESWSHDMSIY